MAEKQTSADQLERILQLIPRVARAKDGVAVAELARDLEVEEHTLLRDIETVIAREYYHPAGSVIDVSVFVDDERVFVRSDVFERPIRFTPKEALALSLGLRVLAAARPDERTDLVEHAAALEAALAREPVEELANSVAIESEADSVRALLENCTRERRSASIVYMKPDAERETERVIHPYALVCGGLHWYVIAYCARSEEVRVFRIDRIFAARQLEESFEKPTDFDIAKYVEHGRVYLAVDALTATVRYSPQIARWMSEKGPSTPTPDGGIEVNLPVADPRWLVRHVLEHAPDAEVVEPPELRILVAQSVRELL